MAKRKSYGGDGLHAGKKQKTNHVHQAPTSEEVYSGRQLGHLLTFEQDLTRARHGLQSFKNVLDSIVNNDEKKSEHMQIVLDYLDSTKPREVEGEVPIYLPDIMETWSMASQMNNENVMSAVPVVLALLVKIISNNVDLVSYGLGICRTLLQKRQQELIAKNLSAEKGRDFIISPTLRLLREAICLDGGALAAPIFRARANTFKSLARNMGLRYIGDGQEDPKRPSVRTNATRLLLSCLKLLHNEAKRDLLLQKDIVAALMRHLRDDPPFLIYEILDVLKTSVVQDKKLAKEVKIKILNANSLTRIASLYGYSKEPINLEDGVEIKHLSVEDAAHDILLAACTDSTVGICRSEQGYYPEGVAPDAFLLPETKIAGRVDFGLDSIPWMNKFGNEIPVRNMLLAEFIESLRPWSSTKQSELLLAIFEASPELIARYFIQKRAFAFDPKLSATWIGYAALLYNVVQLPIPPFFGHSNDYAAVPPPTSVVLDNIVPPPMTLKAVTRCLTNKSRLVSFYAIRLLVLALQKLGKASEMHREASTSPNSIWQEATRRLIDDFHQRIPDLKDVINCYRTMGDEDFLQREAASRLILLYYEIIPQLALRAKFDVSPTLLATIQKVEASNETGEDIAMSLLELEHLCAVAKYSPSMRWFARTPEMPTSPFTTLLRLYTEKTTELSGDTLSQTLSYVADEYQLVESRPQTSGLDPLIAALKNTGNVDPAIWTFIDNCAERCSRTPTKYLEMIEQHMEHEDANETGHTRTCPLFMSIAEQLPFLVSTSPDKLILKQLAAFLREYLRRSLDSGVNRAFLSCIINLLVAALGDKKLSAKITLPKRKSTLGEDTVMLDGEPISTLQSPNEMNSGSLALGTQELEDRLAVPILTSKEASLLRWSSKPPEELVEEGHAASLILLLSSEHASIRKEALTNVIKMAAKIKESTYEENEQIWLLLMELAESAKDVIADGPLPSILVVFACRTLDILKNPLHCLYEKANLFLTSGPVWQPDKIPLMKAILQEGPTMDGTYYTEISWLLGFLVDSLRTPQDVALFHQRKVYEQLFSLPANPYMGINLRTQVLRVLYRTTCIEGGSDTVITRFGAVSWLVAQKAASVDELEKRLYQAMIRRLWETCDQKRISVWSKGSIEKFI